MSQVRLGSFIFYQAIEKVLRNEKLHFRTGYHIIPELHTYTPPVEGFYRPERSVIEIISHEEVGTHTCSIPSLIFFSKEIDVRVRTMRVTVFFDWGTRSVCAYGGDAEFVKDLAGKIASATGELIRYDLFPGKGISYTVDECPHCRHTPSAGSLK